MCRRSAPGLLGGQLTLTEHQPQGPFPEGVEGLFLDLLPGVYGFFLRHLISLSFHVFT